MNVRPQGQLTEPSASLEKVSLPEPEARAGLAPLAMRSGLGAER